MTTDQMLHVALWLIGFGIVFTAFHFKLTMDLRERCTKSEEKALNYSAEMERRLGETRAETERRFTERRDDRVHEQLLFDFQMKALNEKHETQNIFLKAELVKIETSMIALHRRLDDFLNNKAQS